MKFGVAGAPVSGFGVKNRGVEMRKARSKGVLDSEIRRCRLVQRRKGAEIWIRKTNRGLASI